MSISKKYDIIITPTFEKEYKKLKRRFPRIDKDFEMFLDEVEHCGDLGTAIPDVVKDGNKVFKKRVRNSSARKSKRGGFRVIKYLLVEDNSVYLLDIYSKTDQDDITAGNIKALLRQI